MQIGAEKTYKATNWVKVGMQRVQGCLLTSKLSTTKVTIAHINWLPYKQLYLSTLMTNALCLPSISSSKVSTAVEKCCEKSLKLLLLRSAISFVNGSSTVMVTRWQTESNVKYTIYVICMFLVLSISGVGRLIFNY